MRNVPKGHVVGSIVLQLVKLFEGVLWKSSEMKASWKEDITGGGLGGLPLPHY